jgi:hypothetical protein
VIDVRCWTTPNGPKVTVSREESGLPYRSSRSTSAKVASECQDAMSACYMIANDVKGAEGDNADVI